MSIVVWEFHDCSLIHAYTLCIPTVNLTYLHVISVTGLHLLALLSQLHRRGRVDHLSDRDVRLHDAHPGREPGALSPAADGQAVKGHARRLHDQRVGVAVPRTSLTYVTSCMMK